MSDSPSTASATDVNTAIVPPPLQTPPPVTNQTISPGSYSAVGISGNGTTLNLNSGTYQMQSLSVTNGAQVVFNGPTVLYISGDMTVDAASLQTAGNQPSNLLILGTAGCTSINIKGSGTVNAAIYAPAAAVTLTNVTVHGAVVGNTFTSTNSVVNYDVTLRTLTYPGVGQATARSVEEFVEK